MFPTSQSQSQVPQGTKLQRMKSTSDQVIFIANFSRHVKNILIFGQAFHQALLVVTKNQNSSNFEFHIVEYMNDSKAHDGRMVKEKILTLKNLKQLQDLKDLTDFKEKNDIQGEIFSWEKMSVKKQFDIDNLYITVKDIRQKMQQIANEKGKYALLSNNCQIVADKLTEQLLLEEISQKQVIFLAQVQKQSGKFEEGESQPHPALLVAAQNFENQEYHQNYKYYIVEYLGDNIVNVYQFYIKNQQYGSESQNYFECEQSFWETKQTICEFYIQQKIQNIIEIMKSHIGYFFTNRQTVVNDTFKQIKKIQDDEKKRQEAQIQRLEAERQGQEFFNSCEETFRVIIMVGVLVWLSTKIFRLK